MAFEDTHDEMPVWPAFGDVMACLFGIFVLFFVWAIAVQASLTQDLKDEKAARVEEGKKQVRMDAVFARSVAAGRVTLRDGKVGIGGSVLFKLNSSELSGEGRNVLAELAPLFKDYLEGRSERLMVSGFTDDLGHTEASGHADNWELSTARALAAARELIRAGLPKERIVVAGFGDNAPLVPNDTPAHRAVNRRVEIAPVAAEHKSESTP